MSSQTTATTTTTTTSSSLSNKVIVIGVAGGSGAGKTTLARNIYEALQKSKNVAYLIHDDYYKNLSHLTFEERSKQNFDHPNSLDTDLLIQHIKDLKMGHTVYVPQYDFSTHLRKVPNYNNEDNSGESGASGVSITKPKPIILVEGILIFSNQELVNELDMKVYVDAESDIRLIRRISRDVRERGRTADDVMEQYLETVRPMHNKFVEPSKKVADIIVGSDNGANPDVALNMIVNHLKCEIGLTSS
jgi:uridine kinase